MPTITFRRASNVQSIPITDGQIIFDTSRNIILMDNGNVRNQYAGATQLISTTPEATDTNAFNAQASTQLFLQKTTVIDTKANALAVNQNYVPLGCLAFKEALGTSNYSNIGNGTISGALVNLNSGLTGVNNQLNNQLSINNTQFYFDYKNGKYGYNTSAARGADTFHPFNKFSTDYATWLKGKSVSFEYHAWWDGKGQGDRATVSGFIPLVGLDSVTVNASWGGGVGSMEYSIYNIAGQKIGPTRYSGVATIALNGEGGQLRYTFRADPKSDPWNDVYCSITITNAS